MISAGLLICTLATLLLVLLLLARPRNWSLEVIFVRMSWLPLLALIAEAALWKPLLRRLSYGAILPPLLTCIASLFFSIVGATLVAAARQRNEPDRNLVRATLVASIPGMLLLAYSVYEFLSYFMRGRVPLGLV
jgi:hypothetical protein